MTIRYLKDRSRLYLACLPYLFCRFLWPAAHRRHHGKTRIIVFHHIDRPDLFDRTLRAIKHYYNLISFEQYVRGDKATDKLNIIIALDDGYRSWFTAALPLFRQYGVQPLLFVNSDFIGLSEAEAQRYCRQRITTWPEASLNQDELKALAAVGAEIGGHGRSHADLPAMMDEGAIGDNLAADRAALAQLLGASPRCFAYPFGRHSPIAARAAQQAGYAYAFTSDSGFAEDSSSPFLMRRTNIGMRPPLVALACIEGWGERISALIRVLKGRS